MAVICLVEEEMEDVVDRTHKTHDRTDDRGHPMVQVTVVAGQMSTQLELHRPRLND